MLMNSKRLASAPPENANQISQRRSRLDTTNNISHEQLSSSSKTDEHLSTSVISPTNTSKHRFFSLSRRFRFRTQSPEKSATVHFLDKDIDLETKEPTTKKSDKPSRGILKTLRHRSPFRFRSKDAVIIEQEPSPPPPPPPASSTPAPTPASSSQAKSTTKESKSKVSSTTNSSKQRGRLVELKKTPASKSTSTPKKLVNVTPITDPSNATTLNRRAAGLKDLIHKFDVTPPKPKRVSLDNLSSSELNHHDQINEQNNLTIDIPDLLQNVEKDPPSQSQPQSKPTLKHSNSNRQNASFESTTSMTSIGESITTTGSNTRKPTSTARPLMLSPVS